MAICNAMLKYGYSNFELEILEYCEVSNLLIREQYYIDNLKPIYNIAKIVGSNLGIKKSKLQRDNISKALKGKYTGENSAIFGRSLNLETKKLMSLTFEQPYSRSVSHRTDLSLKTLRMTSSAQSQRIASRKYEISSGWQLPRGRLLKSAMISRQAKFGREIGSAPMRSAWTS